MPFKRRNVPEAESASLPDAELVHAARRGDKRAFVQIVARHQAMVCGIALGVLGDFAAAEDAGQEAFLTAWRKIHELRQPEQLRAWLATIARNSALGQVRGKQGQERRMANAPPTWNGEDEPTIADEAPQPDEAAATREEEALVAQALARLPETYRMPLILFYREGKSVRTAAEALGLSEDALKQRLARGREMLRERLEARIETTLTRTAPTAVFTMTVAAAIGALAAPAAVAGTVFASASASVATAAGGPGTTLLTAMSTSKAFLVATVLVATICVPIGYKIHSRTAPPPSTVPDLTASARVPTNLAASFPESALFVEWRALHERFGTNAQAMPKLYKAISEMEDRFRRQAFRTALISEWAQVDPASGLSFFLVKSRDETQRRQFFQEWLARDPRAAIAGLLAGNSGWEGMARDCLKDIARSAPERVPEIAARLPKAESFWDREVADAFAILAGQDLASARAAAEAMTGPSREQALQGVAQIWAKGDFKAAVAWAQGLPDGTDRDQIIRAALVGEAAVDPVGALNSINIVPPGGKYAHFATTTGAQVLQAAADADFDATVGWVAAHPGVLGRNDLDGLAGSVTERLNADPAGFLSARAADGSLLGILPAINSALLNNSGGERATVWDWLQTQPASEATDRLRDEVLRSAAFQDPALALQMVPDLPNTPQGESQIKELARCLFNGGSALGRFDVLYPQAPDRLREPLVEAAFNGCLSGSSLDDPQKWLARLALLPDSARPQATSSLAFAWGQQTPEDAMSWATSLPSGNTQNGAIAAVTSAWAAKDAAAASEYLAALPAGPERDRSAESFALAVAKTFPHEAWDWALSIRDSTEQLHAATETVRAMAPRDPATARQWIDAAPFTPENKAQLQAVVDLAGNGQK